MNRRKQPISYILLCDNPPQTTVLVLESVNPNPELISDVLVVLGMDESNYTNMIINLHRIKAHLSRQIAVIQYYQSCIDEFKQLN
jgi:hypothetical protein